MLRVEPSGNMSWSFKIFENNRPVGKANFAWFQGMPQPLVVKDVSYVVHPLDVEKCEYALSQNGSVIAKTRLNGGRFRHRFIVDYGIKSFELRTGARNSDGFEVIDESANLGKIQRTGKRTRDTQIDLPEYIPAAVRTFILGYGLNVWAQTGEG